MTVTPRFQDALPVVPPGIAVTLPVRVVHTSQFVHSSLTLTYQVPNPSGQSLRLRPRGDTGLSCPTHHCPYQRVATVAYSSYLSFRFALRLLLLPTLYAGAN